MGEKQRVESVHYFPFFPFFTRRNFRVLAIFVFFLSFLGGALALFYRFLRVGAIANYTCAIADLGVFCYRGLWGGEWFPRRKRVFLRWVRRWARMWVLIG